jgi:hypothetical protein
MQLEEHPEVKRLREAYQLAMSMGDAGLADRIRMKVSNQLPKWDKQAQAQSNASADLGPIIGPMMVGAGKKITDWGGGLTKGFDWLTGDESGMAEQDVLRQRREEEFAPLREISPVATSVGEALPSMAIPGGNLAKGFIGTGLINAGISGADEYVASGGQVGDALQSAAFGGAGAMGGKLLSSALIGRPRAPNVGIDQGVHAEKVASAKRLGMELTPAQRRGSSHLQQIEAGMARDPFMSGPFLEVEARNQDVANGIARRAIGLEGTDRIDDYTLDLRHKELGDKFNELVGKGKGFVPLTDDFINKLDEVDAGYQRGLLRDPKLSKLIDNMLEIADGKYISVEAYQQYASDLAKLARRTDDGGMQRALYDLRDGLDYEFEKEFGRLPELKEYRDQWRNLKDIERSKALDSGNFRPSMFYQYARRKSGYVKPKSELDELAINANYFKNPVPNSGTPTGAALQSAINNPMTLPARIMSPIMSKAYLNTGGHFGVTGALGLNTPYPLPELSQILGVSGGREFGDEYGRGKF